MPTPLLLYALMRRLRGNADTLPLRHDLALWRRANAAGGASALARARLERDGFGWCFVLGVNNSGTTLLNQLLARHPLVHGLPQEGQRLTSMLPRPRHHDVPRTWSRRLDLFRWDEHASADAVEALTFDWLRHYPTEPGVLLEKSPPDTVRAPWLQRHFAPASFVAIVRDPFAVAEGIRRREDVSIEVAAEHWRCANAILLDDVPSLERVRLFRYEELCRTPERVFDDVREMLGLAAPFTEFSVEDAGTGSTDRVHGAITDRNAESIDRLSPGDIDAIARITSDVRVRLGYEAPT